jgi:hypothetical protein
MPWHGRRKKQKKNPALHTDNNQGLDIGGGMSIIAQQQR